MEIIILMNAMDRQTVSSDPTSITTMTLPSILIRLQEHTPSSDPAELIVVGILVSDDGGAEIAELHSLALGVTETEY
jgi:hypothetical protein